jgi:hypothetical protein
MPLVFPFPSSYFLFFVWNHETSEKKPVLNAELVLCKKKQVSNSQEASIDGCGFQPEIPSAIDAKTRGVTGSE